MRKLLLLLVVSATPLFAAKPWETFDYAKQPLTEAAVAERTLDELRLMRGIVFGRHGRIFGADRDIDRYLRAQSWYKPDAYYLMGLELTDVETANLDLIRGAEARKHEHVEPGDMRWWKSRNLTEATLGEHTGPELRVLLAEIEAIHGKVFDDQPTLQGYFNARYWYSRNQKYNAKVLTATERANMAVIESAIHRQRKVVLLPGDMGAYMDKPIQPAMLDGVGLHELRLLRNEIYARRGYSFKTAWLAGWFTTYSWYNPKETFRTDMLTPVQKSNAALIAARERELHDALSTKQMQPAMLEGLFTEDLRRLRNEIYARRGRAFKDRELREYFNSFDWYKPAASFDEASLTPVEHANAELIRRMENEASSRLDFEG